MKSYKIENQSIFKIIVLISLLSTLSCVDKTEKEKISKNKLPNVVFILADDVGYGDLESYGGKIPTPNLNKLVDDGMMFTDAHAPAALCAPSRFSMLTGSYPYRSYSAGGAWNTNSPSIFTDPHNHTKAGRHITVAEVMQKAGYRTSFFGKSHLGGDIRDVDGNLIRKQKDIYKMDITKGVKNSINEYGFDYSYFLPSGIQHEPFAFFENGSYVPINPDNPADNSSIKLWFNGFYTVGNNGISEIVEHKTQGGIGDVDYNSSQVGIQLVSKAINFIDNHLEQNKLDKEEKPFLLYFASQAIHVPHSTPIDFDGDPTEINDKINGITGGKTGDFLYELDFQVGKILQKLKEEGLEDNTIVIFTSDNGALWPDICEFGNDEHDNNGVLRDYKASVYEGGHRVPFIVKWPEKVKPKTISREPIVAHDWVATMYELTDQIMEEDQALDSSSLIPLLQETKSNDVPLHSFILYQAGFAYDGAIREADWVLNVNREDNAIELFNLKNDLSQENNLIDKPEHTELISRLHAKFLKHNDHNDKTQDPRTTKAYRPAN